MPVIQVKALPQDPPLDLAEVLPKISADFAAYAGVAEQFVSLTWTWLQPGHYLCAGQPAQTQPATSHPLLVELLVPDFHRPDQSSRLLRVLAGVLAEHTGVAVRNIFIELRLARAGQAFDDGGVFG